MEGRVAFMRQGWRAPDVSRTELCPNRSRADSPFCDDGALTAGATLICTEEQDCQNPTANHGFSGSVCGASMPCPQRRTLKASERNVVHQRCVPEKAFRIEP